MDYRRVKSKHLARSTEECPRTSPENSDSTTGDGNFPLEQARLRLVPVFSLAQCMSILLFGWTVEFSAHVNITVPIISTFITGWTAVSTQSVVMTYLVDVFPNQSAAASASLNLARCLCAAAGTSAIIPMTNAIGIGLAFTFCAAVQLVAVIGAVVQWKFGGKWRIEAAKRRDQ
jgi:hypothetical protein